MAELAKYATLADATFPTSIIIAVEERCASIDEEKLTIDFFPAPADEDHPEIGVGNIAKILDGQHRIAGLENCRDEFDLNVTIFIGADISDQATIFATVNLEQTRVSKSLALDLLALSRSRSPERTCHDIAVVLDSRATSPFCKIIKRLGVATPGRAGERITQATFVKGLLPLISDDPIGDRASLQRGAKPSRASALQLKRTPFRNQFIGEEDAAIARCVWDFFQSVKARWERAWNSAEPGAMLARTNGYLALMRFLRVTLAEHAAEILSADQFKGVSIASSTAIG